MKWISVNDRLPKDDTPVITTGSISGAYRVDCAEYTKDGNWYSCIYERYLDPDEYVTDWIPLPVKRIKK